MTTSDGVAPAAAIDIGSNSIKMTVGRADGRGGIEQIAWASEVVRLGEGVEVTGRLDERRIETAIDVLRRFADQAHGLGATRIVAVATEATRTAGNGAAFLQRIQAATGIDVQLIDGGREAALTFRGLASELDLSGSAIIADIGGGSTELISVTDGAVTAAMSVALGSGRLTERLVSHDPPTPAELAACETEALRVVREALPELRLPAVPVSRLILVGGTPEYLKRMLPEGKAIDEWAVRAALADLTSISATEIAERIAVPEARARVRPAGGAIVAAIASQLTPEVMDIAHSGVRAGLLLEVLGAAETKRASTNQKNRKPRRRGERTSPARGTGADADGVTEPEADFRATMVTLIAERWAAVWAAIPAALAGEDIEGVHDVRVASRRLRAAMDIAAPVFPKPWYKALHRTAKEITGALGEVRDRDVLLEALHADRAEAPLVEHPGVDLLINRVERERVVARQEMETYLMRLLDGPVRGEVERRFGSGGKRGSAPEAREVGAR